MTRLRKLIPLLIPSFLSACATAGGTFAPLGPEHPASAQAAELPITDPSAVLGTQSSSLAELPAPDAAVEHAQGAYVCPMHPEVTAAEPGRCPKCGMKLVPRAEEPQHEEHPHEH
jgi:hypothetical protein